MNESYKLDLLCSIAKKNCNLNFTIVFKKCFTSYFVLLMLALVSGVTITLIMHRTFRYESQH